MKKFKIQINEDLTNAIADTIEAGTSHQGNLRIEQIPLSRVILDPENARDLAISFSDIPNINPNDPQFERKLSELDELKNFAEEIKEDGVLQPIIVYTENGHFHLISGERRSLSSVIAGKTHIPAIIRTKPNDEYKLARIQWNENLQRKDLNLWERLQGIQRLIKSYKENIEPNVVTTPTLISKLANFSLRRAVDYHALLTTNDSMLLESIKNGIINNVEKAAAIVKQEDKSAYGKDYNEAGKPELTKPVNISQKPKLAGRQASQVNLGKTTNTKVVKVLFELILNDAKFSDIASKVEPIDWDNYSEVTKLFNRLISLMEKRV